MTLSSMYKSSINKLNCGKNPSIQDAIANKIPFTFGFLKNMGDFSVVNEIYSQFFAKALPARSTVEVSRLPKDVLVEIDCIAFVE